MHKIVIILPQREITLTREHALNIQKKMINGDYAILSVLDEYGLQELYLLPDSLEEAVKEIEDKRTI